MASRLAQRPENLKPHLCHLLSDPDHHSLTLWYSLSRPEQVWLRLTENVALAETPRAQEQMAKMNCKS